MKCPWYLILFISNPALTQTVSRTVIDELSNLPVPYATVKVLHAPKGTMTNSTGAFELEIEPGDTVLVSSIGYREKILIGRDIGQKIYLAPVQRTLDTVVVRSTRPLRTIILGNGKDFAHKKLKCDGCVHWPPSQPNNKLEFAEQIMIDSTRAYRIQKIYIPTRKKDQYGPLLLRFYAEDEITRLPGQELFFKHIKVDRGMIDKGKLVIDISAEDFYISHSSSFFVSMGWPPEQAASGNPFTYLLDFPLNKENTFMRNLVTNNYGWNQSPFKKNVGGKMIRRNSAYAVELEERVYK